MKDAFTMRNAPRGAQTASRALQLLELVVDQHRPLALNELEKLSGLQVNAVYRLMSALEQGGMVTRERGSRRYTIGPKLIALSAKVAHGLNIRTVALPIMQLLVEETSETVSLHAVSGRARVCIAALEGTHAVRRVIPEGQLEPLYAGPSGKSILAFLDDMYVNEVLEDAQTAGQSVSQIIEHLHEVRRLGYLALVGDRLPGVGGLSAPVFDANGVVASLTVSGPAERWTKEAMELAALRLMHNAAELSSALGAQQERFILLTAPLRQRRVEYRT
jgi:IclR family KDG regulon transcriptional repressor